MQLSAHKPYRQQEDNEAKESQNHTENQVLTDTVMAQEEAFVNNCANVISGRTLVHCLMRGSRKSKQFSQ